jgi:uncharacterized repeat protein (TIGR03806 family)
VRLTLIIIIFAVGCTADISEQSRSDVSFESPRLDQGVSPTTDALVDVVVVPSSADMMLNTDARSPSFADSGPIDAAIPRGNPFSPRQANAGCRLPVPPPIGEFRIEEAFPRLEFVRPLWIGVAPGDPDTILVAEQGGRVYAFDDRQDVRNTDTFLSLAASRAGNEEGLLGLAFHPNYAENGRLFVYYSGSGEQCSGIGRRCSIISEFSRQERRRVDRDSERRVLVIAQPYSNHNGGDLKFGPDGLLYISVGDGGSANDPQGHGQNTQTLLGTILRLDVDGDSAGEYGIPPTNPFVNGGGLPEIYAWGLRNVWRMFFDPSTGVLWAGDVGQNRREEVNAITGPGNFGWRVMEGLECFRQDTCETEGLVPPVHTYDRAAGESITGGFVYRGERLPELWGQYIFADFDTRAIWSLDANGTSPIPSTLLARQTQVSSFGADGRGNLYMTTFQGSRPIVRLARAQPPQELSPFPQRLSETGCFTDVATHTMAAGVIPYRVNVPFWSDGLEKQRYAAFPDGASGGYRDSGGIDLPMGTVLIKTFTTPETASTPAKRVETRMYARFPSGWRGFTWRWNDEQTDATLLATGEDVPVLIDGEAQVWSIPSRTDCDVCHTAAAGFTLGWSARQLNGQFVIDGVRTDQLRALADAGYVDLPAGAALPAHARIGGTDSLDAQVRALLDVNCAPCHQPQGGANSSMDLRSQIPLAQTRTCGEEPQQGDLGLNQAQIVSPGSPGASVLVQRMRELGEKRMPSLGSNRVDTTAVELIERWIDSIQACP